MSESKGVPTVGFPEIQPDDFTMQDAPRSTPRTMFSSGTLPGNTVINLGVSNIKIDGGNRRITINDGTNDIIVLGYLPGGF